MSNKKVEEMNKEELIVFAKEQGIAIDQRASKPTVLNVVLAALAEKQTEAPSTDDSVDQSEVIVEENQTEQEEDLGDSSDEKGAPDQKDSVEEEIQTGAVLGGGVPQSPTVTSNKVIVASNFPTRLKFRVSTNSGMQEVIIMGNAENLRGKDKGTLPTSGAFGVTVLDREVWESIEKKYANFPAIKNGLIFASDSSATAKSEAINRQDLKNGLEPIDPQKTATKPN